MSHMIELNRVSKYYTNRDTVSTGLSKVSLNLDMGEFVAITGERQIHLAQRHFRPRYL